MVFFDNPKKLIENGYQNTSHRVFGKTRDIRKIPFIKWNKKKYIRKGHHQITKTNLSNKFFIVFHLKYASDFIKDVEDEMKGINNYCSNVYRKNFLEIIKKNPNISLFNPEYSIKYISPYQLKELEFEKLQTESFINNKFNIFKSFVIEKYNLNNLFIIINKDMINKLFIFKK